MEEIGRNSGGYIHDMVPRLAIEFDMLRRCRITDRGTHRPVITLDQYRFLACRSGSPIDCHHLCEHTNRTNDSNSLT